MKSRRCLTTILFTDIVGSTERAAELGDRGWKQVLEEHHSHVRREIGRFGGREIKTLGDGFLAAFPRPAQAIRCAWSIRETVRQLGLEVRCGIHTGEVDGRGKDLQGIAVHIGSRVANAAEPGEILVSTAVREMETGAGFRFQDRGEHQLKGVPGEWHLYALEGLPAGTRGFRTGSWIPELTGRHARIAAGAVLGVLGLIAGAYLLTRDSTRSITPEGVLVGAAPGIAVLPFRVGGEDLEAWHEGMVDILSPNLDGIPGFRAIDSRTVLARWREVVGGEEMPDTPTALEVAQRTGARYAVLGSVVPLGENLRIVAELYEVDSGRPVSRGQAEGLVDSIFGLADRLSIQLLRGIVEEEERLSAIDLARATTSSLRALRAYLEGEIHLRHGDYERAVEAYDRAVKADSTFALAWLQLSTTVGWTPSISRAPEAAKRALRHADRLPEREALLVRGWVSLETDPPAGLEALREATLKYPDDALGWYLLGEIVFHVTRGSLLLDTGEARRAFERATEIDPTFAPAYIHLIHEAMRTEPDSARVAGLIGTYERLAPATLESKAFRNYHTIAFGSEAERDSAMTVLDTLSSVFLPGEALLNFSHPRFHDVLVDLLRSSIRKGISVAYTEAWLFRALLFRGQLSAALDAAEDSTDIGHMLYLAHVLGYRIPTEHLDRALGPDPDVEVRHRGFWFPVSGIAAHVFRGGWALERSRLNVYRESLVTLRSLAAQKLDEGDTLTAKFADGGGDALEGFRAWRGGRSQEAAEFLQSARLKTTAEFEPVNIVVRWWEARRALETGELETAARYLLSLSHGEAIMTDPMATLELARVQEKLGRYDQARENYEFFVLAWREADPELQPILEEARQAAIRLRGIRRE